MSKEEKVFMEIDENIRIVTDKNNFVAQKRRKKKNIEEYTWKNIAFFGKFSTLVKFLCDDLKKETDDLNKMIELHNELMRKLDELHEICIVNNVPTIIRERIIIERRIEVVKLDKRSKSGYTTIEKKTEKEVVQKESDKDKKKIAREGLF